MEGVDVGRSVEEHRDAVRAAVQETARGARPTQVRPLTPDLSGRLARAVHARRPIPGFDDSQMDGFAVRADDLAEARADRPVRLRTTEHVVAGLRNPSPLAPGTAAPIMTGAPLPPGATAVVPIEHTRDREFGPSTGGAEVVFTRPVEDGAFIRRQGSDLPAGDVVLPAHAPLTPAAIGALLAAGVEQVEIAPDLRIAVVSTGSEIAAGDVPDVNGLVLQAATAELGLPCTRHAVPDDPDALRATLEHLAARHDLVITSGGVSAGTREVVRQTLEGTPGSWFGHVDVQPGGPQGLAVLRRGDREVPVVCLPGNPVSVLVSFELFLRPALAAAVGRPSERPTGTAALAEPLLSPPGRLQVRRGTFDASGHVALVGGPGSHLIASYARADLLVFVPKSVTALAAGDSVTWWRIR